MTDLFAANTGIMNKLFVEILEVILTRLGFPNLAKTTLLIAVAASHVA